MRHSFYDSPKYKKKQAEITHKYWQSGTFDFKRKALETRYCQNPQCKTQFQTKPSDPKIFCGLSCTTTIKNLRRSKKIRICEGCGRVRSEASFKYCSNKCQTTKEFINYIAAWKKGIINGNVGIQTKHIAPAIRKYLLEKYEFKCSKCSWSKVHPITKHVPLEVNHIDGNADNNLEENLQILCPNCHSLTHNFRNLNKGNGRSWRKPNNSI
jgi:hypothetical protein